MQGRMQTKGFSANYRTVLVGKRRVPVKADCEDVSLIIDSCVWVTSHGYLAIRTEGGQEYFHRLIKSVPKNKVIDHVNGNKLDNRKANLRICSQAQNCLNKRLRTNNRTGVAGVWWRAERGKWAVQITVNSTRFCLGHYSDKFEAICARISANNKYHGEYAATSGVLRGE